MSFYHSLLKKSYKLKPGSFDDFATAVDKELEKIFGGMNGDDIGVIAKTLNKISNNETEDNKKRKGYVDRLINSINKELSESKFK
jgi:hypothetical protein